MGLVIIYVDVIEIIYGKSFFWDIKNVSIMVVGNKLLVNFN